MNYSEEFQDAVNFSKEKNLFLGYGNPNGKILMIGKESYYKSHILPDTEEFYQDLLTKRDDINVTNNISWKNNTNENFQPNWDMSLDRYVIDSNAMTIHWNQKNKPNRLLKDGHWNQGTSNTYLQYQKIYQNVFLNSQKESNINFQKQFFISELNDLVAKRDFKFKTLTKLKKKFILQREELFNLAFFKSFPVIIVASGDYFKDYNFNLEKVFEVEWNKETILVGKSWYNMHKSTDGKRLLIHTRQLSTSVTTDLINALSNEVKAFLKK